MGRGAWGRGGCRRDLGRLRGYRIGRRRGRFRRRRRGSWCGLRRVRHAHTCEPCDVAKHLRAGAARRVFFGPGVALGRDVLHDAAIAAGRLLERHAEQIGRVLVEGIRAPEEDRDRVAEAILVQTPRRRTVLQPRPPWLRRGRRWGSLLRACRRGARERRAAEDDRTEQERTRHHQARSPLGASRASAGNRTKRDAAKQAHSCKNAVSIATPLQVT